MLKSNTYNRLVCMIVGLAGFTYGFGFAVFVTSIGQPGFYIDLSLDPTSTYTANILGALNALFTAGAALGAFIQGYLADWVGRKKALLISAIFATIGAALSAGSVNIAMLITVRILQGCGLGMAICLVPLYISEVAPAAQRGFLSGFTVMSFGLGYTVCSLVSIGAYFAKSHTVQWRLPLSLACIGPLALIAGLPFVPESPRWLIWNHQPEKALEILVRMRHAPNDPENTAAHAEQIQIVRQVELDRETTAGYIQMFRRPSWRRRSLLAFFLLFASQSTGILGISNFLVLIFAGLGLKGVMPLVMYGIWTCVGTTSVLFTVWIVDRVGRRTLILIGYPVLACCLLAEALLQNAFLDSTSTAGLIACLLFLFIYIIAYQAVDAPSFILAAEIFPTNIRAKGVSIGFIAYFVGAITYTTPSALAFKNIGWRMYLIYMGLCIVAEIIVYYFVLETKCLPMEEIGALFGDSVAVYLTDGGHGVIENDKAKAGQAEHVELVENSASMPKSDTMMHVAR